jgi:hypothetical protein
MPDGTQIEFDLAGRAGLPTSLASAVISTLTGDEM